MRKREWNILVLAGMLLLLCGCAFNGPEDLYAVPRAAEGYAKLQEQIDKVRNMQVPSLAAIPSLFS